MTRRRPWLVALLAVALAGCAGTTSGKGGSSGPAPQTAVDAASDTLDQARKAVEGGDYARALALLQPLADQGDARAQAGLGHLYSTGSGVARDEATAAHWYRLAAEQGHPIAQYNLGVAYLQGLGVQEDHVEAFMWVSLAASEGLPQARDLYDELAASLDRADREEGKRRAREWQSKASGDVSPPP